VTSYSSISIEELVRRCTVDREVGAWEEFVRRFHRLIAVVVLRNSYRLGDSSAQTVDDLIQETYLKLCGDNFRLLQNFSEHHPDAFLGYLQVVTANVVRDHFKSSHAQKRGNDRIQDVPDHFVCAADEDSAGSPKAVERAVLIREIQSCLDECLVGLDRERNKRIFWLHYRAGLSASAIASMPGIGLSTKGVETTILRTTRDLRKRMAAPTRDEFNETRNETEGIRRSDSF
jgi:RNA polymerase sigma-70 factor (ECF subfamily)